MRYNVTYRKNGEEITAMYLDEERRDELVAEGNVISVEYVRMPTWEDVTCNGQYGCE